mmetsp:Transcript_19146/g.35430  ORF Transcript_19146/g.35430 Transcript_19146/m.35430 type:complete len:205 (+) Transcript_19146:772-1386(+)
MTSSWASFLLHVLCLVVLLLLVTKQTLGNECKRSLARERVSSFVASRPLCVHHKSPALFAWPSFKCRAVRLNMAYSLSRDTSSEVARASSNSLNEALRSILDTPFMHRSNIALFISALALSLLRLGAFASTSSMHEIALEMYPKRAQASLKYTCGQISASFISIALEATEMASRYCPTSTPRAHWRSNSSVVDCGPGPSSKVLI